MAILPLHGGNGRRPKDVTPLNIDLRVEKGRVVMSFSRDIGYVMFAKNDAIDFANMMKKMARQMEGEM